MIDGTEREVLELLLERPWTATAVADELGVSVQTASRNLKALVDRGFARQTREGGDGQRGYKYYESKEFARVFAGYDGELFEETLELTPDERAVLSVWKVPQPEFHPVLLSYLFATDIDRKDIGIVAVAVYGSVARGDARPDSDVDVLVVRDPAGKRDEYSETDDANEFLDTSFSKGGGMIAPDARRVVSETWFTISDFRDALDAGSRFLRDVLEECIVLYDPGSVIRDARQGRTGERVPG